MRTFKDILKEKIEVRDMEFVSDNAQIPDRTLPLKDLSDAEIFNLFVKWDELSEQDKIRMKDIYKSLVPDYVEEIETTEAIEVIEKVKSPVNITKPSEAIQADRFNEGKLQWSQVDFQSLESLVMVLEGGAKKYSKDNWKKGHPITDLLDSLLRHVFAFKSGETLDPESGVSHIGHIMANAMFIEYNLKHRPENDNR